MRIGIGYDIHRLVEGRRLVLGGVEIPYIKGLEGHSDADVLLHAICDGLLGAIGEGDIGTCFPDTDLAYKDISSLKLLERVGDMANRKGYTIDNIDTIIVAEEPKVEPFKEKMKEAIAGTLGLVIEQVNIKAKTSEGLGFIGREEAIAAHAVVLVRER